MDSETYIIKGICEHLGNKNVYKKLTKTEVNQQMYIVWCIINIFLSKYKKGLSPAEIKASSNALE